ncbi:MAG: glycosyltransferase family 9 protein, partial [Acidobacteria bacterium]|nr:glycosyltransferase family 9 protein [Acidobacteriota bacterium]
MKPSDPSKILPGLREGSDVLILRLRSMGDMVLLTPALAALHAWRPELKLHVVSQPAFAPVLEGNPAVTEIIPFRTVLASAQELRRRKFPVLFNQHGGPTSAVLTATSRVPVRICWAHCQFGFVYNVRVPGPSQFFGARAVHTVEHRMTQFYHAGLPRGPIPPAQVFPQADAIASVREKLRARGITPGQRYAVIHPGASHPSKQWPLDGFAQVARWLHAERGMTPVIRLGPNDAELAAAIPKLFGKETVVIDAQAM